jgi:hypothetical protein
MRLVKSAVYSGLLCAVLALGVGAIPTLGKRPSRQQVQSQGKAVPRPLSNSDVLEMLKAGLGPDVVVAKIKTSPCDFDTSPATLESLKRAGVPNSVVMAMVEAPVTTPESLQTSARPRVYVSASESWSIAGWASSHGSVSTDAAGQVNSSSDGFAGAQGGTRPQTAEIIKTLNQRCPGLIVTDAPGKADYALLLDHEGGKGLLRHKNKIAAFDKAGDAIFSDSTFTLGGSVEGACQAITRDFAKAAR